MPKVGKKKYPYTTKGRAAAKKSSTRKREDQIRSAKGGTTAVTRGERAKREGQAKQKRAANAEQTVVNAKINRILGELRQVTEQGRLEGESPKETTRRKAASTAEDAKQKARDDAAKQRKAKKKIVDERKIKDQARSARSGPVDPALQKSVDAARRRNAESGTTQERERRQSEEYRAAQKARAERRRANPPPY